MRKQVMAMISQATRKSTPLAAKQSRAMEAVARPKQRRNRGPLSWSRSIQ